MSEIFVFKYYMYRQIHLNEQLRQWVLTGLNKRQKTLDSKGLSLYFTLSKKKKKHFFYLHSMSIWSTSWISIIYIC